jgi:hypothetical protein
MLRGGDGVCKCHNIEDVVVALRQQNSADLHKVFSIACSHKALKSKN